MADETPLTEILNGAETAPAGTVTDAGTEASEGAELERLTTAPPAGAGEGRTTWLATEFATPTIVVGTSSTVRLDDERGVFSTFAETYAEVHVSTQGSSVKSVAIDCAQGAAET